MSQIQVDTTITLSVIVMFCSILSPILTTWINNRNQRRLKVMEYQRLEREEAIKRQLDIYDGYIRAVGACMDHPTEESLADFSIHTKLILYYIQDQDLREDVISLEQSIRSQTSGIRKPAEQSNAYYDLYQPLLSVLDRISALRPELPAIDYDGCLMHIFKFIARQFRRFKQKSRSSAE